MATAFKQEMAVTDTVLENFQDILNREKSAKTEEELQKVLRDKQLFIRMFRSGSFS